MLDRNTTRVFNRKRVVITLQSGARYMGRFHTHNETHFVLANFLAFIRGTNNTYNSGDSNRKFKYNKINTITIVDEG